MKKSKTDPISEAIQSRMYDEAKAQQEAFALLHNGLKRYRQSGLLLSETELKAILLYRQSLVMSSQERWLLEESKRSLEEQQRRQRRRYLKIAVAGLSCLLIFSLAAWGLNEDTTEGEGQAFPKIAVEKTAETSIAPPVEPGQEEKTPRQRKPETKKADLQKMEMDKQDTAPETAELQEKGIEEPLVNPFSYTIPVETSHGKVLRVRKAGKWGLADTRYNVLLPLKYRRVRVLDTTRGYFILEYKGKRGIANAKGTVLLPPRYDKLGEYQASEHLLIVYEKGKAGLFDLRSGRPAIELQSKTVQILSKSI